MIFEIQRNRQQAQFPSYMKSIQENCSFHLSRTAQQVTVSLIKVSDIFCFYSVFRALQSCRRHLRPFRQLIRRIRRHGVTNEKTETKTKMCTQLYKDKHSDNGIGNCREKKTKIYFFENLNRSWAFSEIIISPDHVFF